ncbi:MAG: hypothetical protein ACTHMF_17850 [Leifsonia sp.]|uniref:hypothetical protein n=1 Tax=Leifsonia sp. TaxID=1870902 RepID=UPI003F80F03C
MRRALLATAAILSVVATVLSPVSPVAPLAAETPASAADGRQFDPGNIISDQLFFDGGALSASAVQSFLAARVPTCRSGYTCLKDYRQSTASRAAVDGRCGAYTGAAHELASTIIAKVGAACGISQKAILVLLEKEQSLVTDTWPSSGQYRSATGYGCPDTAACDSQYYGFFNQVYNAALQFKRYAASPTSWNHIAGRVNAVRYSPNASCGSSNVYIQNQATAGLYNYTPYQPNAAALSNLYGTGDSCSSYGNRNFWRLYTDWFGATTIRSSLLRTPENPRVYLVSGTVKYPVLTQDILTAYAPLGQVGYVSQSYLDAYSTAQAAGRVLRGPDNTIYFTDANVKLRFGSCDLVAAYGGRCATDGYVQLTAEQLAGFANGPQMGPVLGTSAGARYYVTGGTKREILDAASQAAAGLPATFPVLTENAVAALPSGRPVVRDAVFAAERGTSGYSYLGNGMRYTVNAGAVAAAQASKRAAGSLWPASLATLPSASGSFNGVVTIAGSSSVSVLSGGGRYVWTSGGGALSPVPVPQGFLDSYPSSGQIATGAYIKSASSPVVYLVTADKLRAISTWDVLVAMTPGPTIATVPDALLTAIPKGTTLTLPTNTLWRTASNPMVYLINGTTNKIALTDLAHATDLGVKSVGYTTQSNLDAYQTAPKPLGFGIVCGTTSYVSAGGAIHAISDAQKTLYPFAYAALDSYACRLLKVGGPATSFIRTPDNAIYQLVAGQKRHVTTMDRYNQLAQGQTFLNVSAAFGAAIPTGPAA